MWEFPYGSHSDRFELWLGRGKPLSPYLKGLLVSHLLAELRPRDLKLAPDELYPSEGVNEMTERTLIRNWLSQWLKYVHWYWSIASRPDANLQEYLEGPVIERSRKMKSINPSVEIVRVWSCMEALRYVCWKRYGVDGTDIARKVRQYQLPSTLLVGRY
ncbi:hypothetical protein Acr_00g0001770 [Actinidia rufa]|uniref:Uncharacterized protein n=1 Tax=Actinidia rufa TaxID=165716 RepID=A0A7J0D7B7_9ERIC|nr:hypothetical protein Acr_00g0001770 [Actinidia rufa]